jgi:hypothetical protein
MSLLHRTHRIIRTRSNQIKQFSSCQYNEPYFSPLMASLLTGSLFTISIKNYIRTLYSDVKYDIKQIHSDIKSLKDDIKNKK